MGKIGAIDKETRLKEIEAQREQTAVWRELVQKGAPIAQKYFEKKSALEGAKMRWGMISFVGILFAITLVTAFLVYVGRVDASNFTFLMGTLIGASITLVGDLLMPAE